MVYSSTSSIAMHTPIAIVDISVYIILDKLVIYIVSLHHV